MYIFFARDFLTHGFFTFGIYNGNLADVAEFQISRLIKVTIFVEKEKIYTILNTIHTVFIMFQHVLHFSFLFRYFIAVAL